MKVQRKSWYLAVDEHINTQKWAIEDNFKNACIEYCSKEKEVNYRSVTLLRRKQIECWKENFLPDSQDPPIIWTFWSHHTQPPMILYLEELNVRPEAEELILVMELFRRWLVNVQSYIEVRKFASKNHPRAYLELPPHRKYKQALPINQIKQMENHEAILREYYAGL